MQPSGGHTHLALDGVPRVFQPGVVVRVVQHQALLQVLLGVVARLVGVDEEEDEEDELSQENDQEHDEELQRTEEVSRRFFPGMKASEFPATHAQQQALVLLDGAEASQEARHHDDAAQGDDEVGGRERWEGGRQAGEAALGHG